MGKLFQRRTSFCSVTVGCIRTHVSQNDVKQREGGSVHDQSSHQTYVTVVPLGLRVVGASAVLPLLLINGVPLSDSAEDASKRTPLDAVIANDQVKTKQQQFEIQCSTARAKPNTSTVGVPMGRDRCSSLFARG